MSRNGSVQVLRRHVRVTAALVRREMRARFGASRIGYLWAVIEVLMHLGGLIAIFTYIFKRSVPIGTSTALFLLSGIIPYFLVVKLASYLGTTISANRPLLNLSPVKIPDVIAARVVLETSTYLLVAFLILIPLYLDGIDAAIPSAPFALVSACVLAISLGTGVGMINIVLLCFFERWMTIFSVVTVPLWMFSGLWFLPEQIPQPFREYILYNPIVHIVQLFRIGFFPAYHAASLDIAYVTIVATLTLIIGSALMHVARRSVIGSEH